MLEGGAEGREIRSTVSDGSEVIVNVSIDEEALFGASVEEDDAVEALGTQEMRDLYERGEK